MTAACPDRTQQFKPSCARRCAMSSRQDGMHCDLSPVIFSSFGPRPIMAEVVGR